MDIRIFRTSVYFDSTNTVESLIDEAVKLGHTGVAITDHESVSAHVRAIQYIKELRKKGVIDESFSGVWGNEIYLVDSLEQVRDNYKPGGATKFPHFLLLAKNKRGHEFLRRMSSIAWEQSYMTGLMRRTPTVKADLEEMLKEYQGDIIMSNACLGGELAMHIINDDYDKAEAFIEWCISLVGKEDFYLEIQPNTSDEQTKTNKKLVEYSKQYGLDIIVTFDAHYLNPSQRPIHSAYLNAKEGDRETDSFYADTYYHELDEVYEKLGYLGKEVIDDAIANTDKIGEQIEQYDLYHDPIIPQIEIPEFEIKHLFAPAYDQFPNIKRATESKEIQDRYIVHLIEEGFLQKEAPNSISQDYFYKVMARIDEELYELLEISDKMNQIMSGYYITVKKIIDIIWEEGDSLVGGRGSVGAFYLAYLLDIIDFNPLTAGIHLPSWRHLDSQKSGGGEISDVDLDSCATRRPQIMRALRDYFGEDRLLSVATFGTETAKSAIRTSASGLGYNSDDATYLGSLVESSRGMVRSLNDSLTGRDGEPINEQLKNEMAKYPNLTETALSIESLINKSSSHAGGVCIYNQPYWKTNAAMRSPSGMLTTQFNLKDSEYLGDVKYDILTTEAMDKLREGLDLLIEHEEIEWQGTLRKTFNKYFHPNNLEYDDPKMYELMATGTVPDLFQFTSELGIDILKKVKPTSLLGVSAASNLMRLQAPPGKEQPVDTFAKHQKDISLWYDEMREYGLTDKEISILEEHLLPLNGVCDSQESLMAMVMDKRISDFDRNWANKLRKAIAKKDPKSLEETQAHYRKHCKEIGVSQGMQDYIWDVQIFRQLGYSFPSSHSLQYGNVMMQELNMSYRFSPVYWQTACLNMNSGSVETEGKDNDTVDYGKVSTAVSKLQKIGVNIVPPSINKSKYSFVPDAENNAILYGLKPIKTINKKIANSIIENRPYNSLDDVLEKLYETKIITNTHLISLVKSGTLDEFGQRKEIMMDVIRYITDTKDSYTLASINKLIDSGALQERPEYPLIQVREKMKNKVLRKITTGNAKTPHKVFKVTDMEEFDSIVKEDVIIDVLHEHYEVDEKMFKRYFDKETKDLREWLKTPEAVDKVNRYELNQQWLKYALGSYSSWEMETLNYYYHEHELKNVDFDKYGLTHFSDLSEEPVVESTRKWKDRDISIYKISQVAGVVLGVNKMRHSVTLLDPDGSVFDVKYHSGSFSHYDKTISEINSKGKKKVIERSWFGRGQMLIAVGFRRGNQFVAKTYKHSISQHTTKLITDIEDTGDLYYRVEREF